VRKALIPLLFSQNPGVFVLKEKWDNLIILDACRYDVFEEAYRTEGLQGRLESRISRGTETKFFLSENFRNRAMLRDTVYVSANPVVSKLLSDKLFKVVPIWKDGWDPVEDTVLPEYVYERTLEAIEQYPDKRLIVHFLQPHRPFIGYANYNWWKTEIPNRRFALTWGSMSEDGKSLLFSVSTEDLMELYKRNLKLTLPYVRRLLDVLPGTTVVTGDHGEAFGERIHPLLPFSVYGHPGRVRIDALTRVPWFVAESRTKKIIRSEPEIHSTEHLPKEDEDLINERLSALGYI